MRRIVSMLCFGPLLFLIVSCGPKYACRDTMGGVKCETPTEVYQHLMEGDLKDPVADQKTPKSGKNGPDTEAKVNTKSAEGSGIASRMEFKEENIPIRIQPRVVRLWLAPWEDSEGDLHMGGFIFIEVAGKKRWVIGEKIQDLDSRVTPQLMSPLLPKKDEEINEKSDSKSKTEGSERAKDEKKGPVKNIGRTRGPVPPLMDRIP